MFARFLPINRCILCFFLEHFNHVHFSNQVRFSFQKPTAVIAEDCGFEVLRRSMNEAKTRLHRLFSVHS